MSASSTAQASANRAFRQLCPCYARQRGMTLIELTVVLVAMVAVAGMVIPYVASSGGGGGGHSVAACIATDTTLVNIRDAIMGTSTAPGFRTDLGMMPSYRGMASYAGVTNPDPDFTGLLSELYHPSASSSAAPYPSYNASTRHGWNGPYLTGGMTCSTAPHAGACRENNQPSAAYCVATALPGASFALDSYTNTTTRSCNGSYVKDPIQLRIDDSSTPPIYFLVSGGPDGIVQTDGKTNHLANRNPKSNCSSNCFYTDDRVLVLNQPDPGNNQPCTQ
jgi:prepilin-type N-terminal cleavage/methylation domain-containing protein